MSVATSYDRGRQLVVKNRLAVVLGAIVLLMAVDLVRRLASGELAVSQLVTYTWDGLMRGLVIGLAGIGLSLTYSILSFANFAHGDYITTGAFAGWATTYLIAGGFGSKADLSALLLVGAGGSVFGGALGINAADTPLAVVAGAIVAGIFTVLLALAIDRFAFKSIRDAGGIPLLITSVGVAFVLRYLLLFVFGSTTRGTTAIAPSTRVHIVDGMVTFDLHDLVLIIVSASLMLGVHILLNWTKLGKAMRAMSDNESLAQITGIPTEGIIRYTWIIGGGLTGIAGYMFILWRGTLGYNFGWTLLLLIFAAVILGGIGSIYGAIVGGLVIGVTASTAVIWLPSQFARAAAFFVMIVVLLVRPKGIFGGRETA